MTITMIENLLNEYINIINTINNINKEINKDCKKHKMVRNINFPSEISENIVKFFLRKKYNTSNINWNILKGDLKWDNDQLEIKGFSSSGPSSFGPTEQWDKLYFIDCIKFKEKKFKIYEICLSNNDNIWKNIKLNNKGETFNDQCNQKRRPRIKISDLKEQISEFFIDHGEFNFDYLKN